MYYLLGISIIILGLFLTFHFRLKPLHRLICKGITSMCFIVLAIVAYLLNKDSVTYFSIIMIGLVFGFLGDIALGIKEVNLGNHTKWMTIGICLFFIGHIFYIIIMERFIDDLLLYIVISVVLIFLNIIFIKLLKFRFQRLKYLIYLYSGIAIIFLVICILNAFYDPTVFKIVIAIGASSFVTSDYVLSFVYFKQVDNYKKLLRRLNLGLYYCGQFLLALSIFLY